MPVTISPDDVRTHALEIVKSAARCEAMLAWLGAGANEPSFVSELLSRMTDIERIAEGNRASPAVASFVAALPQIEASTEAIAADFARLARVFDEYVAAAKRTLALLPKPD